MQESLEASLVRIRSANGRVAGAGFLVGERHILTCAHVITKALGLADDTADKPSSLVSLDFPRLASHTLLTARVVFWSPVQDDGRGDIAGLELLDKPPAGTEAVHFAPSEQVWGHPYRAFGFPAGQDDGVWSDGCLLARQGINWIQLEDDKMPGFAVIAGFSGAPVWDEQLQGVVGMIVASSQPATTKTAFAIPSDMLIASWPQLASLMRPLVPRNPYKGLRAFTEHDTRDFFGRDSLTDELATAVETALTCEQKEGRQACLLAVLGPSGSGKSSVVMAGLLPCLRNGGVFNSEEWVYLDPVFPGAHPLEALAVSLAKQLPARSVVSFHDDLASASARSLHLLICQLMASSQQRAVLIVDQFEEVFTLTTDEAERRHLFELLVTAVTEPRGHLFVILTLRADFYDRPMHYRELYRLIDDHHVSVLPMETEDLRKVIEKPANLPDVQLTFESGLVDELLFEMRGQSGALPLLEFTLDQLFQQRNGHRLTLDAYQKIGGVKGALAKHAEATYTSLPSEEHRRLARALFLRLIDPGVTEQDTTRRRAALSELSLPDAKQTTVIKEAADAFIAARLLTTNEIAGTTTIEVSHEALIHKWSRLAGWLREARDDIPLQQAISEDAAEWEQRNKPRDRLYRGSQLKEARAWARRNIPSGNEVAFLHASVASRVRFLVSVIAVLLIVVSSMGGASWVLTHQPPKPPDSTRVSNTQDNDKPGSLRYAVDESPSGSTIRFDASLRGKTILLTSGDLIIARNLKILGPGANVLSISSGKSGHSVHVVSGTTVTISGLTFKDSKTAGFSFIYNEGTLTITNSIISGNTSSDTGGGITNTGEGKLTLTNSTVSKNRSTYGGGIYNNSLGELTLIKDMIFENVASEDGGGIYDWGLPRDRQTTITSCTIRGNTAHDGGGIFAGGHRPIEIRESQITGNHAPLHPDIVIKYA